MFPITANFDMASVLKSVADKKNADAEALYKTQMDSYVQAVQGWVTTNVHSRELSKDPLSFKPTDPPTVPVKTVYAVSGTLITATELPPDPSIPAPVLPKYEPPSTFNMLAGMAPKQNSNEIDYLVAVLSQMQVDIAAIKKAVTQ